MQMERGCTERITRWVRGTDRSSVWEEESLRSLPERERAAREQPPARLSRQTLAQEAWLGALSAWAVYQLSVSLEQPGAGSRRLPASLVRQAAESLLRASRKRG